MKWIFEQADTYGWGIVILAVIAAGIWRTRQHWLPWFGIHSEISAQGRTNRLRFEQQLREKVLLNGEEKDQLIKWVQHLYEDAVRAERANNNAGVQFADVMVQSFKVLDRLCQRLDAQTEAIRENSKVLGQAYFVIRRERQRHDDEKVVE